MIRRDTILTLGACLLFGAVLTACGGDTNVGTVPTAMSTSPVGEATMTATVNNGNNATYPKLGHAPDYSWIAGWVSVTKIQSGCVYIRTDGPPPTPAGVAPTQGISGPIVSTAVKGDTSPPLRDITPEPPSFPTPDVSTGVFVPSGPGWDESMWKDGDYVVAFGRIAGAGDAREMCPGGAHYVIDKMQANP